MQADSTPEAALPLEPEQVAILLVDDRPENLLALEAILEPLGHTLVRAASGEQALRAVLEQDFAVILLDVQMPGIDGFETARLLKSRARSAHTPIIFLTALRAGEEYVTQGYATGAVDYMSKPFQPDVLRAKVAVFVDLYRSARQVIAQAAQLRVADLRDAERNREADLREAELRHRAELLEAERDANRVKSDFLATMSHELRTPLNAVIGYASLLRSGIPEPLGAKATGYAERIESTAQQLLGLINEILTFSRIEARGELVDRQPVRLAGVVRDVATVAEPLAAEKGLGLRIEGPPDALIADTDPGKLRQILINLIGNAIKFTDAGEITLRVEVSPGAEVVFRVEDTGIGIAPDKQERIWEPFYQADGGIGRKQGGAGLGLAVSHRLAQLLGGALVLERSEPGHGSTFTVRLPLSPGPTMQGEPPSGGPAEPVGTAA